MSLYNMIFGVNRAAPMLLAVLGLKTNDIPRFRDCFLAGDRIVIHTRTGGGNRDYYSNSGLTKNAFYLYDEDDDFDSTYANFYFRFPDEYAEDLKALAAQNETHTPSEKWQALFQAIGIHEGNGK